MARKIQAEGYAETQRRCNPREAQGKRGGYRLASQAVQGFASAVEVCELFFFGAEFGGVGDQRATGAASGVLDVEHLVVEDVFNGASRDVRTVHAAI